MIILLIGRIECIIDEIVLFLGVFNVVKAKLLCRFEA